MSREYPLISSTLQVLCAWPPHRIQRCWQCPDDNQATSNLFTSRLALLQLHPLSSHLPPRMTPLHRRLRPVLRQSICHSIRDGLLSPSSRRINRPLQRSPCRPRAVYSLRLLIVELLYEYGTPTLANSFVNSEGGWIRRRSTASHFDQTKPRSVCGVTKEPYMFSRSSAVRRARSLEGKQIPHMLMINLCLHSFMICVAGLIRNRQSTLQQLSPFIRLPKYFSSEWSYASYRLPAPTAHITLSSALRGGGERGDGGKKKTEGDATEDAPAEKCTVGWIEVPVRVPVSSGTADAKSAAPPSREKGKSRTSFGGIPPSPKGKAKALPEHKREISGDLEYREEMQWQLVVLTYSGCWYRLSVPTSTLSNSTTATPAEITSPPASTRLAAKASAPVAATAPVTIPRQARTPSGTGPGSISASPPKGSLRTGAQSSTPPRPSPLHTNTQTPATALSVGAASTVRGSPSVTTTTPTYTMTSRKGKEREASTSSSKRRDSSSSVSEKASRKCDLEEFRRFGRWDGWI